MINKIPEIKIDDLSKNDGAKSITKGIDSIVLYQNNMLQAIACAVTGINKIIDELNEITTDTSQAEKIDALSSKLEELSKACANNEQAISDIEFPVYDDSGLFEKIAKNEESISSTHRKIESLREETTREISTISVKVDKLSVKMDKIITAFSGE